MQMSYGHEEGLAILNGTDIGLGHFDDGVD
jgi:hypothetical protein